MIRIRIPPFHFDADPETATLMPDPNPASQNDLDPQHWLRDCEQILLFLLNSSIYDTRLLFLIKNKKFRRTFDC